jgi:hypothetical protein
MLLGTRMIVKDLLVTQNVIRSWDIIDGMINHLKNGGNWSSEEIERYAGRKCPLIQLTKFPNGGFAIHDGHHRIVSTFLSGRLFLHPNEYEITELKRQDYMKINLNKGWVTPFNVHIEVRLPDFLEYKAEVLKLAKIDRNKATKFIRANKNRYAEHREAHNIFDVIKLSERFKDEESNLQKTAQK